MKKTLNRNDYNSNNKSKESKINRENFLYKKRIKREYLMNENNKDEFLKEIVNNNSKSSDKIIRKDNNINKISFWRKKIILKNNIKNKDNIYYNDLNNNIDLIRKKKELEEEREKERKIMSWFYINDISITKRDLYNNLTIRIQSVFRGWKFRKKIKNIIKTNSNKNNIDKTIYFSNIINGYSCLKKIYINLMKRNLKYFISKTKNKDNKKEKIKLLEEIKELINQNNDLQKKLEIILNDSNNLKKEAELYKDNKNKYKEIFSQFEKMYKMNNNYIEENQNLKKKLNNISENAYNYLIIDKLKSINYLSKKNNKNLIDKNTQYELKKDISLKIEKKINLNILSEKLNEVQNINKIKKNYLLIKESNLDIIPIDNKIKKEELENNTKIKILRKYINKKYQRNKDLSAKLFFLYKNKINEIKIKEQKEIINNLKKEIEKLNYKIKEKEKEEDKILKIKKLKSIFEFKKLFLKKELYKYFISFYHKTLINKNISKNKNELVEDIKTSIPIPPNIKEVIPSIPIINKISNKDIKENNINKENKLKKEFNININYEKNEKERKIKEEKEEKEKKERLLKSRNLRKLLARRVHEKKDNIRKYFYKYAHISMMIKIRSKLIEMKRKEIEKRIKEEKKENAKYKIIQSYRDKQQRIASLFNKLDKKLSFIKRNVLNAWNVKCKVMAIKMILLPLKNSNKHKKKKKKKLNKNEENKNEDEIAKTN